MFLCLGGCAPLPPPWPSSASASACPSAPLARRGTQHESAVRLKKRDKRLPGRGFIFGSRGGIDGRLTVTLMLPCSRLMLGYVAFEPLKAIQPWPFWILHLVDIDIGVIFYIFFYYPDVAHARNRETLWLWALTAETFFSILFLLAAWLLIADWRCLLYWSPVQYVQISRGHSCCSNPLIAKRHTLNWTVCTTTLWGAGWFIGCRCCGNVQYLSSERLSHHREAALRALPLSVQLQFL